MSAQRAQATVFVLGLFPHGVGGRCRGCSGADASAVALVVCLGQGFLFDVCSACCCRLAGLTKTTLDRTGAWS